MPRSTRFRPDRWFPESQAELLAEQEPPRLHTRPAHVRVAVNESILGGSQCATCLAYSNRECTCCRECNRPALINRRCEAHDLAHRMTVEREQRESFEQTEMALAQLRMAGLL